MDFRKRLAELQADRPDECWIWEGSLSDGYGSVHFGGKQWKAHRLAYELLVGPIPPGLHLDHTCPESPRRACFNPAHLEPVTQAEDNRRKGARRTHCRYGHEWTPENTIMVKVKHGLAKWCRECGRERSREHMRAKLHCDRRNIRIHSASECRYGHSLTDGDYVRPSGHRECRTCRREANRRAAAKRKQQRADLQQAS